jgi:pyrimidine operon attenuation protein/uracil phosphoribosyltransferase
MQSIELMSPQRLQRSLRRIALEIIEKHKGNGPLCIFGLNERGYHLSKLLSFFLEEFNSPPPALIHLDVINDTISGTPEIDGAFVVLLDDVIFSGSTFSQALEKIKPLGTPAATFLATLIDRGHRTVPLKPQFIGLTHPTKLNERVEAKLPDTDGNNRVLLFKP